MASNGYASTVLAVCLELCQLQGAAVTVSTGLCSLACLALPCNVPTAWLRARFLPLDHCHPSLACSTATCHRSSLMLPDCAHPAHKTARCPFNSFSSALVPRAADADYGYESKTNLSKELTFFEKVGLSEYLAA